MYRVGAVDGMAGLGTVAGAYVHSGAVAAVERQSKRSALA